MPLTLLHPGLFIFGIAAVAIPIVLHLLKRKRRPIPWGAMRFLEQAYRKRRRVLTIEQLILLILRCTLLALIAGGVGSLMLGSGSGRSIPTTMVIVLDDSIGSALTQDGSSTLETNKDFALLALDTLSSQRGDQVMLIGAGMPARGLVIPQSSDIEAVRSVIQGLEATDSMLDLARALELAGEITRDPDRTINTVLVLATAGRGVDLSQSQASSTPAFAPIFDRVIAPALATSTIENIGIANASPTRSLVTHAEVALPIGVRVELIRSGIGTQDQANDPDQLQSTIRVLDQLGAQIGHRVVQWGIGQAALRTVIAIDPKAIKAFDAQAAIVRVEIDDDANLRDNTRSVSLATRTMIRVGVIDQPLVPQEPGTGLGTGVGTSLGIPASRWVRSALAPDERFGISVVDLEAARALAMIPPNLDALIVLCPSALDDPTWDRIKQLNESGMLVLITPDAQGASLDWFDRVGALAPEMLAPGPALRAHQSPARLDSDQTLPTSNLLAGIGSELDALARPITVTRWVRLGQGAGGGAMLMLDDGSPLAVQSRPTNRQGVVVVLGVAFDLEWSNLVARPMFVPMMQEIVRQGVGRSSAMPTVQAGEQMPAQAWVIANKRITLEAADQSHQSPPITPPANPPGNPNNTSIAGVIAQLDSQGAVRSLVIITPDAQSARTDPSSAEELERAILARVDAPGVEWIEHPALSGSADAGSSRASILGSPPAGVSIALWLLLAAGLIAAIECVLARLFTAKLTNVQAGVQVGVQAGAQDQGARA